MARGTGLILLAAAALAAAAPADDWQRCAAADPESAIAGCTTIIDAGVETGSRLAAAHYDRGIALRNRSQFERAHQGADPVATLDRALADYGEALRLRPDYAEALVARAIVWFDKGQYDRAVADCDAAIRLRADLPEAYNNRALAYYRKGLYHEAQADFDRTISLRKNYGNALILRSPPPYGRDTMAPPDEP
jgi:tetratricopeptide (TPR) repeat protein